MSDEQKPGDPADKAIDAKADGAFGGAVSHRAGYGGIEFEGQTFTKLKWAERTARMGGTLAAGEGRMLLAEIDRLRAAVERVRALHVGEQAFSGWSGAVICPTCNRLFPCPTLRALEETPCAP